MTGKDMLTLSEIAGISGMSETSVRRRIDAMGIRPCASGPASNGKGSRMFYTRADAERIKASPVQKQNRAGTYYRVSVLKGGRWIVAGAGLTLSRAQRMADSYASAGLAARCLSCAPERRMR